MYSSQDEEQKFLEGQITNAERAAALGLTAVQVDSAQVEVSSKEVQALSHQNLE